MHNLKVENYVLFKNITEYYSLETESQIALRNCFKEVREEPDYVGVFARKIHVVEHQNITANYKKTDISS